MSLLGGLIGHFGSQSDDKYALLGRTTELCPDILPIDTTCVHLSRSE